MMATQTPISGLSWFGIVRLGTVQAAIGAIVMLATSLLNRVMVVEYTTAAAIPAALVAWHYAVQLSRPLWGYGSDRSPRRTPWIITGMGILALGAILAVDATIMMANPGVFAAIVGIVAFTMIGIGVGISGTALLALLASRVTVERKPAAAAISWTMMVAGIVVAAGVSGAYLDPFSEARLAIVCSLVALGAFSLAMLALRGVEDRFIAVDQAQPDKATYDFKSVLTEIWQEKQAGAGFVFTRSVSETQQQLVRLMKTSSGRWPTPPVAAHITTRKMPGNLQIFISTCATNQLETLC